MITIPVAAFGQDDGRAGGLVAGKGREETARTCTRCHQAGQFVGERLDRADWEMVMSTMIDEYAMPAPTDAVRDVVLDYLSANFGPESDR